MNTSLQSNSGSMGFQVSGQPTTMSEAESLYRAAIYLLNLEETSQADEAYAIDLLKIAAAQGHPDANFQLGVCYEGGLLVARDLQVARAYYEKAKQLGNKKADKGIYGLNNPPDVFVSVEKITEDYDKNPFAADVLYKGKTVRVGERIAKIGRDDYGNPYIILRTEDPQLPVVVCCFDKGNSGSLVTLRPGSGVLIQGKVEGCYGTKIVLVNCWVVYDI